MEIIQVNVAAATLEIFPKFVPLVCASALISGQSSKYGAQAQTHVATIIVQSIGLAAKEEPTETSTSAKSNTTATIKNVDTKIKHKNPHKYQGKSLEMHTKYDKKSVGIFQIELRERLLIWQLLHKKDHKHLRQVCSKFKKEIDTFIGLPVVYNENNTKKLGPIPPASSMKLTGAIVGYHLENALRQSERQLQFKLLTNITLDGPIRQHLFTLLLLKSPNLQILRATEAFKMDPSSPQTAKTLSKISKPKNTFKNSISIKNQNLFLEKLQHLQFDGSEEIKFNRFFTILNIKDILTHFNFPVLQTFEINFFFAQSAEIYELVNLVCNCILEYRRTLKHLRVALRQGTDANNPTNTQTQPSQPQQQHHYTQKQRDFKSLSLTTLKIYVDQSISLPFYVLARAQNNLNVYEVMKSQSTWSHHIPILLRNHESLHTVRIYAVEPIINLGAFVGCTNLKILHISRHYSAHNNFNYAPLTTQRSSAPTRIRIGEIIQTTQLPVSIRELYLLGYNIESHEIVEMTEKLLYLEVLDIQLPGPGPSAYSNSGTKYKLGLFPDTIQKILSLRQLNKLVLEDYLNEFSHTYEFIRQIIPKINFSPDHFIMFSKPRCLYIIMITDMEHKDKDKSKADITTSWSKRYAAYL